jgi:hypothetical protein
VTPAEVRGAQLGSAYAALTAIGDHEGAALLLAGDGELVAQGLALILSRTIRNNGRDPAAGLADLALGLAALGELTA